MSRIGVMKIEIPNGVEVTFVDSIVTVKGPKGVLTKKFGSNVKVEVKENNVVVSRINDEIQSKSDHGTTRSIIKNMIYGVVNGYEKVLELQGIGYRASMQGKDISLNIGFTHPVIFKAVDGIEMEVKDSTIIFIRGIDKQLVGEVAARIRSLRKPEPYKGKGIKYQGEVIRRKTPKTVSA